MLTRRGWSVAAGSFVVMLAGRLLGTVELYVLAAGGLALCALAWASVWAGGSEVEVTRRVSPARAHAGGDARVDLVVTNRSRRRAPALVVADAFAREAGLGQAAGRPPGPARLQVAPLRPGEAERASYRLPTARGLFRIGPADVTMADPFGLAARTLARGGTAELTVYPRVEPVAPPPSVARDPRRGGERQATVGSGEEFYGLRPYQIGDDLRRVHWPSTARQNDLMIRQPQQPWQGRATIVLDTRAGGAPAPAFEEAVSAAASLVAVCYRHDAQVRLATTSGFDSGPHAGPRHLDALLEHLAVVAPGPDHATEVIGALGRHASGALVVVAASTGRTPAEHLGALGPAAARYAWSALVLIGPAAAPAPPAAVTRVVRVEPGHSFATAWNRTVGLAEAARR